MYMVLILASATTHFLLQQSRITMEFLFLGVVHISFVGCER